MPFESEKQRRFMWAKHPEIAKRWAHEYGSQPVTHSKDKEDRPSMKALKGHTK